MSKNFVFDDALNELAGIAKASDENLMDEIGAVRTEFANADDAVRVEFAAADDLVREEFATADNTVRSEFAAEDETIRSEFAAADTAIRGELATAQATLQSAIDGKLDKTGGTVTGNIIVDDHYSVYGSLRGSASGNAGMLQIASGSSSATQISAGTIQKTNVNIACPVGWHVLAVAGFMIDGTGAAMCSVARCYVENNSILMRVANHGTTTATITSTAYALLERDNLPGGGDNGIA